MLLLWTFSPPGKLASACVPSKLAASKAAELAAVHFAGAELIRRREFGSVEDCSFLTQEGARFILVWPKLGSQNCASFSFGTAGATLIWDPAWLLRGFNQGIFFSALFF